jgi:hypothetical protein
MSPSAYTFRLYAEGRTKRRAVGFILGDEMNAASFFDSLQGTPEREFRDRFDRWIDGDEFKKWFHGWDVPEFRECFEFKRQRERLFGFKCHPKPKTNSRLQLVALAYYDDKEGEASDKTILRRINRLRIDTAITQAIKKFYPEYGA